MLNAVADEWLANCDPKHEFLLWTREPIRERAEVVYQTETAWVSPCECPASTATFGPGFPRP